MDQAGNCLLWTDVCMCPVSFIMTAYQTGLTLGDHSVENVSQFVGCYFHILWKQEEQRGTPIKKRQEINFQSTAIAQCFLLMKNTKCSVLGFLNLKPFSSSFCTDLAAYLLKNSPELLVLLALFPRWSWCWLRRHWATKHKNEKLWRWSFPSYLFFTLQTGYIHNCRTK